MSKQIWTAALTLALALGAGLTPAFAGQSAEPRDTSQAPAVCPSTQVPPAGATAPEPFTPRPQERAVCSINCPDGDPCRHNSDCTAAPGGYCSIICLGIGCCVY